MHKDAELIGGKQIKSLNGWSEANCYGRSIGEIDIKNYDHFSELIRDFDLLFNTKTYIVHAPIHDILLNLRANRFKEDPPTNEIFPKKWSEDVDFNLNRMFQNRKSFFIKDCLDTDKKYLIAYFNRIGVLVSNIKQNIPLKYSMGLHHTKNFTGIHPGGARTFITGIYKEPVYFLVTDYTGKIKQDFNMFKFYNISDRPFPIDNCKLRIGKLWKNKNQPIKFENIKGLNIFEKNMLKNHLAEEDVLYYKEVDESSLEFKFLDPSIEFKLENKNFYVNNECILIKQKDDLWRINI